MKKNIFWILMLCILIAVASKNGWDIYSRIAVAASALVVLIEVSLQVIPILKRKVIREVKK